LLAQQPDAVDGTDLGGLGGLRAFGPMKGDEETRARLALDLAGRDQPLVGIDNGIL